MASPCWGNLLFPSRFPPTPPPPKYFKFAKEYRQNSQGILIFTFFSLTSYSSFEDVRPKYGLTSED
jgi:hypothetical protein